MHGSTFAWCWDKLFCIHWCSNGQGNLVYRPNSDKGILQCSQPLEIYIHCILRARMATFSVLMDVVMLL